MDIRQLLTYSDNTRRLLQETLAAHPDVFDQPFETLSRFRSIRQLVAHIAGAEESWVEQRLCGRPVPVRYEQRAPEGVDAVFAGWEQIRARTRAFLDGLHDGELQRVVSISLPHWGFDDQLTIEQMLFHVINHQTYHLGQVSMVLQQRGIDPPNFDYVFLHGPGQEA